MARSINNTYYLFSHSKPPKGRGRWNFRVHYATKVDMTFDVAIRGTYREASRTILLRHPSAARIDIMP